MTRVRLAFVAGLAAALTLSGCAAAGGQSASDPADVFAAYLADLESGDYTAAFARVASTDGIDPDTIVSLGEVEVPELVQVGADLEPEATSGSIAFSLGAVEGPVGFSRVEDRWMLDVPLFVAAVPGDTWTDNAIIGDLSTGSAEVSLPDGSPLTGAEHVVALAPATYLFPATYEGGAMFDPMTWDYTVTLTPSAEQFGAVEVTSAAEERPDPVFSAAFSREVLQNPDGVVVNETVEVPGQGFDQEARYTITVDEVAETDLNECTWTAAGPRLTNPATVACTPVRYTVTFVTDWPGFAGARYTPDSIGTAPHPAGTTFTFTDDLPEGDVVLRLSDPDRGEADDPRESAWEIYEDVLARPAS
jgi:hypothetical protein